MKQKSKSLIVICALIGLASTAIYIYAFGFGLWKDHTKWAEMGNFFGGILGPFFSLISVYILAQTLVSAQESVAISERTMKTQAEHAKVMLEEQRTALTIQQFDLIFLSQLKVLMEIYQHAKLASNPDIYVDAILTEKFDNNERVNIDDYLPILSPAINTFDYLVKYIEDFAPPSVGKNKYREMIIANTHVSFRWFIGKVWEKTHPSDKEHRQRLNDDYGIISRPS
ncbi:hypothetical protein [Aeromonas veronii]|uniref:hypothetical protein n=1 Tax=Aeromonas veronii TaxID=654 RepID=UPI003F7A31CE